MSRRNTGQRGRKRSSIKFEIQNGADTRSHQHAKSLCSQMKLLSMFVEGMTHGDITIYHSKNEKSPSVVFLLSPCSTWTHCKNKFWYRVKNTFCLFRLFNFVHHHLSFGQLSRKHIIRTLTKLYQFLKLSIIALFLGQVIYDLTSMNHSKSSFVFQR